ncbi:hypothetical protein L462_04337, partial [Enterobacter sp. BIDMC 26]
PARVTERFVYAGSTQAEQGLNLAGVCVSHHDTAGLTQTDSVALTGVPLSVTRRLLKEADSPDAVADWQGTEVSAWNGLLADEAYTTLTTADAAGAVLATTDAKGNRQRVAYDVAGRVSGSWLTVKGGTERVIVSSLAYSAAGQKLREVHGNGVVTTYTYEPQTQRLTGIKTERPAGHAAGTKVLQDLRYEYDPVGNVLGIRNDAEETRFWRNQKVVPESTYTYDSLYRLVSATGREMANAGQGSHLPSATVPLPADSSAYTNYTRTYAYDAGDNLTQIRHSAPATNNTYTTKITISNRSNRGVLSTLTESPAEVDGLFTAGGQQTQLQPGQALVWTARNELLKVTPVVRDGDTADCESYRYDAGSQRVLKVSVQKTNSSTQTQRVVYLPGLELRTTTAGGAETESLQVMTAGEAGRAQVRVLHWTSGRPDGISNNQVRYSHDNLTGSSGLELDGDGNIISTEEYYPFGGTAILTARSQLEADYKTVRYSGKERDATGLYYYGYRYYQPWSGRWLSADPAGTVDGLNLFRMCRNNPVTFRDPDGLQTTIDELKEVLTFKTVDGIRRWDVNIQGEDFILHTREHKLSKMLIVSTHGLLRNASSPGVPVPEGKSFIFFNPHHIRLRLSIENTTINRFGIRLTSQDSTILSDTVNDLFENRTENEGEFSDVMFTNGVEKIGYMANYSMKGFESNEKSYSEIAGAINSDQIDADWITMTSETSNSWPDTVSLLDKLGELKLDYDTIVFSFCRESMFVSPSNVRAVYGRNDILLNKTTLLPTPITTARLPDRQENLDTNKGNRPTSIKGIKKFTNLFKRK